MGTHRKHAPEAGAKRTTVYLRRDAICKAKKMAADEETSMSAIIEDLITKNY